MDPNEICTVCGEPRHAHVATDKGPLTHPREARGEGIYEVHRGTQGFGLDCHICMGPCSMDHEWQRVEFKPSSPRPPRR
jgi:hypothetical protein